MVLPLAFTESMATRAASRRVWTCASKAEKEEVRMEDMKKKLLKRGMARKLIGSLGVAIGELVADVVLGTRI